MRLKTGQKFLLDPDISLFSGSQYPNQKENFGIFLDSMPDTWGRTLMKRKAAQLAKENNVKTPTLYDIDFLLGVYDESRMGALRFKIDPNGDFLDNNKIASTPPWSSIRELQNAAENIEDDKDNDEITFQVYDMNGRLLLNTRKKESFNTLDMSSFANGTYILRMTRKGVNSSWRIIKTN